MSIKITFAVKMEDKEKEYEKLKEENSFLKKEVALIFAAERRAMDTQIKLDRELSKLKILQKISAALLSAEEFGSALNYAVKILVSEMNFEKSVILIKTLDKENNVLSPVALSGYGDETESEIKKTSIDFSDKIIKEAMEGRRVLAINKETENNFQKFIEIFGLNNFLLASLVGRNEQFFGFILAGYSKERASVFSLTAKIGQEEIDWFSALAAQISASAENANMIAELKQRIKELESFHRTAVGRELKMIELKKEIKELKEKFDEFSKNL